jgi:two-component system response regulator ChvI
MHQAVEPNGAKWGDSRVQRMTPSSSQNKRRIRILLVDDEEAFRESLKLNLQDEGFEVIAFDSGEAVLNYMNDAPPADVLLLDWRMPGLSGIEVLRRLRRSGNRIPVVFLTGLSHKVHEQVALEGGAVDFVDKSRSLSIVVKRLMLIGGGMKGTAADAVVEPVLTRGPLQLRVSRAFWRNQQVDLTLTEFNIVHLLASRAGQDVSYREIYDLVHGRAFIAGYGADGYRANVRSLIKRIRQKFRSIDPRFTEIENFPGLGYRWRQEGTLEPN